MKKSLVLTLALAVGLALAGCSKDIDDTDPKENAEQTLIKQVVGVWRSGDSWVSFDGKGNMPENHRDILFQGPFLPKYYDGYSKAVLKAAGENGTFNGIYLILGNTITAFSEQYLFTTIKYAVTDISDNSMTAVVTYTYGDEEIYTDTMTFHKTSDAPVNKD